MARIKRPIKYTIILTAFFMFYFMFIDKNTVHEDINYNRNIIENFPREDVKIKQEQQVNGFNLNTKRNLVSINENKYIFNMMSPKRLNKLFNIIHEKEKQIELVLRKLNLIIFDDIIKYIDSNNMLALPLAQQYFKSEIKDFLQVIGNKIQITNKFIDYLNNQSDYYSFYNPRVSILKQKINDVSIWTYNEPFIENFQSNFSI